MDTEKKHARASWSGKRAFVLAGASGTGKTVTLKVMAEGFSKAGVPVFLADAKGDVLGMCQPGEDTEKMQARIERFGIEGWSYEGCPCRLWNILEGQGLPCASR